MALKQRAEQSAHIETLGWEEEEEGMQATNICQLSCKAFH